MYSSGASQLLFLPVLMQLLFLHGGSFAAPLVSHSSNATDAQDHAVLDIAPGSQIFISDIVVPNHTSSSSTLQSIIQAGARYIQPLVSYLQGLMGTPELVETAATPQSGAIRSRLRGLKKVDLV